MVSYESLFKSYGMNVVVDQTRSGLSKVVVDGYNHCGDGRGLAGIVQNKVKVLGPKVFGATIGLADIMAADEREDRTSLHHLEKAIFRVKGFGFTPSYHNINKHEVHCGQQAKMVNPGIKGLPPQEFTPLEAAERIRERGGDNINLKGEHEETELLFNLVESTTRVPDANNQRFCVDAWFLQRLGISSQVIVSSIVETASLLSRVNTVRIMDNA